MDIKIKSFTDLITWQKAHQLVLDIYRMTISLPSTETYGLISQIKRSAVSISSNIAEGFSRKTNRDKTQFYYVALGSLTELQNLLLISRDLKYISNSIFSDLTNKTVEVSRLINSLIKALRQYT